MGVTPLRGARSWLPAVLMPLALFCGCAHSPPDDPDDPLETVNRGVYTFNETADRWVLRPVAKGYDTVMPGFARTGVRNFFSNLFYPTVIVNDVLQWKLQQGARDFCRFVLNTTFGVAGLFDVATPGGLTENDEDFGQTLGYWGVGPGWYLMLPFLGPSDNRDFVGKIGNYATDPLIFDNNPLISWGLSGLNLLEKRAQLLQGDRFLEQQIDRYVFIRSIYLQNRLNRVYDGNPPKEDFEYDEEDGFSSPGDAAEGEPPESE
jgi:phospholipid-binding lipoprotein MlaA